MYSNGCVLLAKDLTKAYIQGSERIIAVNRTNLEVKKADFIAITGQSGSGKTTLLNILGCVTRPDSGELWIGNAEVIGASDKERASIRRTKIGYVFQDFKLLPALTAQENILLPMLIDSEKINKQAFHELCELLEIDDRLHYYPSQLSGGQQQRVAIARALIRNPEILLADEPTGNLDSHCSAEIMEILRQLNHKGSTILMVTHNEHLAEMCSRRVRIEDGYLYENS